MNLEQLKKKGGLISSSVVPKEIKWTHVDEKGKEVTEKFTVQVRRHSFADMENLYSGIDADESRNARYVSRSVLLGDGSEELSYEDASNLEPTLGLALLNAVNEVNNPSEKKSPPPKTSGTSSS